MTASAEVSELARRTVARFYVGDCRQVLAGLDAEFAQCVVTSPPFWGLRDYKIAPSVWGDPCCEHPHEWVDAPWKWYPGGNDEGTSTLSGGGQRHQKKVGSELVHAGMGRFCSHVHDRSVLDPCPCWLGQLGLEPWPSLYVEHIVEAFRFVRRAMKKDGVLWLEIGDSYAGSGKGPTGYNGIGDQVRRQGFNRAVPDTRLRKSERSSMAGIKPKDLLGIPWSVAFALRADGWWLRQDNVWSKPAPMPESVKDRTTRAHSYLFQLTKSRRCYYDAAAIAEQSVSEHRSGNKARVIADAAGERDRLNTHMGSGVPWDEADTRNKRSVWTIPTRPYKGAHFATMPPELCEDPIKATSRPGDVALDPFSGTGTVALVAARLGRDSVGIDAKAEYVDIARRRLLNDAPMLLDVEVVP